MKHPLFIFVAVLLGLLFVGGGYLAYTSIHQKQHAALVSSYVQAYRSLSLGGGDVAIAQLNQVASQASKVGTADDAARANIMLAAALFDRNQGGDRVQAAATLKTIAGDTHASATVRAIAYLHMAGWLYTYRDEALMKQFVFNTPPYSDYLAQQGGDVSKATIQLFGVANTLSPSAFAYYQMAGLSALALRSQGINTKDKTQLAAATTARQDIASGDALLPKVEISILTEEDPAFVPYLYLTKSTALSVIEPYFADISTTTVALSFETAISAADGASISLVAQRYGLIAKLGYAVWLNTQEHSLQNAKIENLLQKISSANLPSFDQYMVRIQNRPTSDRFRAQVVLLAKLSPEFTKYLAKLGWKV